MRPQVLLLAPGLAAALRRAAARAHPLECCGLLLGEPRAAEARGRAAAPVDGAAGVLHVTGRFAARNAAADPRRAFELEARTLLACERRASALGCRIVGSYHSHPDAPAVPSRLDAARLCPENILLVVGACHGAPRELRAWWRPMPDLAGRGSPRAPRLVEVQVESAPAERPRARAPSID